MTTLISQVVKVIGNRLTHVKEQMWKSLGQVAEQKMGNDRGSKKTWQEKSCEFGPQGEILLDHPGGDVPVCKEVNRNPDPK